MLFFLGGTFIINLLIFVIAYKVLYNKRKLFSDRYGMVMAMCTSGILSLNIGMSIEFLFFNSLSLNAWFAAVIGGAIGICFGSLVKFQSLLSGFFHGVVGSMMGIMLGAIVKNPALCSLPASYLMSVNENIFIFSLFGTVLVIMTFCLVYYSLIV
ncbi:hypothetical protein [Bacillus taeanensis]|uniref:Uncharacterized protein n=1 Tax=Bacillus taeanensis TaxID=273032 RepID=A0A366XXF0_9BACI|nr:hypothetical protein [Bacillus taeanensis]RBW70812.1 hypothetical protein DS031_04895 [Bacillus taeanensis]